MKKSTKKNKILKKKAKQIRRRVLKLLFDYQKCHLGSNMSVIEIMVVLYYDVMKPKDIFLPKGHAAAVLYAILSDKGLFTDRELNKYFKTYNLVSHNVPGVIFGSSLGQSLSVAAGLALADRTRRVFCLMTDGEMQEGSVWEAMMFAAHHKLSNLIVIIDYNKLQAFGRTNEVVSLKSLHKKCVAFNWDIGVLKNGHSIKLLRQALDYSNNMLRIIIAHTTKGKGVSFAEDVLGWHYWNMDKDQYKQALKENQ